MKNFELSKKNVNLIIAIVGILIFGVSYMLGYQNLSEKNDGLDKELSKQNSYLTELKGYQENLPKYEKGINNSTKSINKMLGKLPRGVAEEDFLVYLIDVDNALKTVTTSISLTKGENISEFDCMIDNEIKAVTGFETTASITSVMTYKQMKEFLKYINEKTTQITFLNSFSMTFNGEQGSLNTNANISKYYITFDGSEYKPVAVPKAKLGTSNLFG